MRMACPRPLTLNRRQDRFHWLFDVAEPALLVILNEATFYNYRAVFEIQEYLVDFYFSSDNI